MRIRGSSRLRSGTFLCQLFRVNCYQACFCIVFSVCALFRENAQQCASFSGRKEKMEITNQSLPRLLRLHRSLSLLKMWLTETRCEQKSNKKGSFCLCLPFPSSCVSLIWLCRAANKAKPSLTRAVTAVCLCNLMVVLLSFFIRHLCFSVQDSRSHSEQPAKEY